jgi:hypothetical protein
LTRSTFEKHLQEQPHSTKACTFAVDSKAYDVSKHGVNLSATERKIQQNKLLRMVVNILPL